MLAFTVFVVTVFLFGLVSHRLAHQPGPAVVVVVCWLTVLFFSFGLFTPTNGTVSITLFMTAISAASSVFLILELDRPFGGLIKISSEPLINTLKLLGN